VIGARIEANVRAPEPNESECRRWFDTHPEWSTGGGLVEARHILFAATPGAPVQARRALAEQTLAELKSDPAPFAEQARELSNGLSGAPSRVGADAPSASLDTCSAPIAESGLKEGT